MSTITESLAALLAKVTRQFVREKRRAAREERADRLTEAQLEKLMRESEIKQEKNQIKAAAWSVMEKAYMKASVNGRLPARPRQIMYGARPLVLELIGSCWKSSDYFTQRLLPDFLEGTRT